MNMWAVFTDAGNMVSWLFTKPEYAQVWAEDNRARFYWRHLHVRTLPVTK